MKNKTMKNNQESIQDNNRFYFIRFQRSERCLLDAHWRLRRVEGDFNTMVNANSGDKDIIKRND
jgi:hypothetical protein